MRGQRGKRLGRPPGSNRNSKLDTRLDEIMGCLAIGLTKREIATVLRVAYNTLDRFIDRKKLQTTRKKESMKRIWAW